jgi:hypothetical protein
MNPGPYRSAPSCFFVFCLVIGLLAGSVIGPFFIWPVVRANFAYVANVCTVLDKRLDESMGDEGPTYRPEFLIEYEVAGQKYRTWTYKAFKFYSSGKAGKQEVLDGFVVGKQYPCWYDPADPNQAVLVRDFQWLEVILALVPLPFLGVGIGGLIYVRKKAREAKGRADASSANEPMSEAAQPYLAGKGRGAHRIVIGFFVLFTVTFFGLIALKTPHGLLTLCMFAEFLVLIVILTRKFRDLPASAAAKPALPLGGFPVPPASDWPTVPRLDSEPRPGQALAFHLATSTSPGCTLFGALFLACFWNGILSIFVVNTVKAHLAGQVWGWLELFLVPFVLVGLGLIGYVLLSLARLLIALGVGRLRVEVSAHPLRAGGRYGFLVDQSGLLPLSRPRLDLVCEEFASYTHGTSTITNTKKVCRLPIFLPGTAEGERGPDGWYATADVPAGVMHSFQTAHNKINWKLVLRGWAAGFLPYTSEYPVLVYPASSEGEGP